MVRSTSLRISAVVTLVALSVIFAPYAQANSVVSSVPAVGAVLSQAPNAVSVTAATTLLSDGNSLSVTDPNGAQVDDGSLTITDTTAVVGLKPLISTGIYTVTYTLLSATDAPLAGSYTFLYNAPAAVTTPSVTPTPLVTSPGTPTSSSNSSANVAVLVFLGLATVVALFLIWYAGMIWKQYRKNLKSIRHAPRDRGAK
jgi:methionine-rich copper-binding protein CopC